MMSVDFTAKYQYALIRYVPDSSRGEWLNVGLVIRDDKQQIVKWNDQFSPPRLLSSGWDKEIMREWEEFYKEEMVASIKFDERKLQDEFWDTIRTRCHYGYVLSDTCFTLNNIKNIESVAEHLFNKLVCQKRPKHKTHRETTRWATDYFQKLHLFDKSKCRYPLEKKKEEEIDGIKFILPFYQENGKKRPIWPAPVKAVKKNHDALISPQGNSIVAAIYTLRQQWGDDAAEYWVITRELNMNTPDVKAAKKADAKICSIDDPRTVKELQEACGCH